MRKLRLDIDSLAVQTFEIDEAAKNRGTVQAHDFLSTSGGTQLCPAPCDSDSPSCQHEVSCLPDC